MLLLLRWTLSLFSRAELYTRKKLIHSNKTTVRRSPGPLPSRPPLLWLRSPPSPPARTRPWYPLPLRAVDRDVYVGHHGYAVVLLVEEAGVLEGLVVEEEVLLEVQGVDGDGRDFPDERRALVRGEDGELVVVEEARKMVKSFN